MGSERTVTLTNPNASTATYTEGAMKSRAPTYQSWTLARLGHILTGTFALVGAIATATNIGLVQLLEGQMQSLFFVFRGPVVPPDNIVILAMDEESLTQGQIYHQNPEQNSHLEPLKEWPWKRAAYAKALDRLMAAGAKTVGVDVILDTPSRYGEADDRQLRQVLQRYPGRVTLAAVYEEIEQLQGFQTKLTQPQPLLQTQPISIGSVNYPLELNGRIYRLSSEYRKLLEQRLQPEAAKELKRLLVATPSFDEAVLKAAGINYPRPQGEKIYFYGPKGTFEQIPFWYVLDPNNWNGFLQQGQYFKDKIVLIGPTATDLKDSHKTPVSGIWRHPEPMPGIEIHANAIATLLEGKSIGEAIPHTPLRGLFVLLSVAGAGFLVSRPKRAAIRLGWTVGIIIAWGGISYVTFIHSQRIFPTAVPMIAIAFAGVSYMTTEAASEQFKKRQLRETLAQYATSPIVQEILSQQDDFQDLLPRQKKTEPLQTTIGGRYEIVKVLGAGGFGETYIAQDKQRPGSPLCVVKHLKPARNDPKHLQLARRLFQGEAEALERLGQHNQIPQLLAYFEELEEFYLVQEFIAGHPLDEELLPGKQLPEAKVIDILQELLEILEFVHQQGVIHRDIKPSNIIRRHSDGQLVLIDFGAVKEINTQLLNSDGQSRFTIGIGTQGYAPNEQCAGRPRFNSDIYAIGMTGIQALTGLSPSHLHQDVETGETIWLEHRPVSPELAAVISKMVRYDYRQRYQTVSEAKQALFEVRSQLPDLSSSDASTLPISNAASSDDPTVPWLDESTVSLE